MSGSAWERLRSELRSVRSYARRLERADPEPPIPPPLPPGRTVHVPGRGEMFVREIPGDPGAPTIVLLHGWTLTSDVNWFRVFETVARHGRVLAVDQRGHGRGIRSEQPFTLNATADDVAALLEQLDAAPAAVVGYSLGGSVALLLARRHPECVSGLVLESTALQWRSDLWERLLWSGMATVEYGLRFGTPRSLTQRYLRHAVDESPELAPHVGWLQAEIRRADPSSIAAAGRALSVFDARSFAGRIQVPTAVIVSGRDRIIRPKRQRELAAAIPGAELIELEAAHNGWMVRPDEVAAAIDKALTTIRTW